MTRRRSQLVDVDTRPCAARARNVVIDGKLLSPWAEAR